MSVQPAQLNCFQDLSNMSAAMLRLDGAAAAGKPYYQTHRAHRRAHLCCLQWGYTAQRVRRWVKLQRNRQCSGEHVLTHVMMRSAALHMSVGTESGAFYRNAPFSLKGLQLERPTPADILDGFLGNGGCLPFDVHCEQPVSAMFDKTGVLCMSVL